METKNRSYIGATSTLGGIGGAIYGFRHPSEAVCKKISAMTPSVVDTMKGYLDSFSLEAATNSVKDGSLKLCEYGKVKNIVEAFKNTMQKEKIVQEIADTPFLKRTKSLDSAIKEANSCRPKMYKAVVELKNEFQEKLIKLGVFDKAKFQQTTEAAKKKAVAMYKELSKGTLKGLAVGIAAGVAIGYAINKLVNSKKEQA